MASESHSIDIQQKRFEKEIKLLSSLVGVKAYPRQTAFGVIVRVVYSKDVIYNKEVQFDLYLEGKYPFQAPKLVCESVFSFPSVSDGRDILSEILKQKWTPSITSADIIGLIPQYFISSLLPIQQELQSKDFGKFHLGSPYYLETWDRKESMGAFYCIENDIRNPKFTKERVIVITHTVILILELNPQYPGIGYLVSWATLQSLNTIKRSRQEPDRITFEWKKIGDNPAYSQQFKVGEANELIDLISRNMQKIGAVIKRQVPNNVFKEDEVNGKAIKKMNINEILQAIEVYEDNLETQMTIDMINSLLQLYQQAIEYFAAVSNPQYDIFLQRMHMLLANDGVMAVMQGKNNEIKNENEEKKQGDDEKKKVKEEKGIDVQVEEEKSHDVQAVEEQKVVSMIIEEHFPEKVEESKEEIKMPHIEEIKKYEGSTKEQEENHEDFEDPADKLI